MNDTLTAWRSSPESLGTLYVTTSAHTNEQQRNIVNCLAVVGFLLRFYLPTVSNNNLLALFSTAEDVRKRQLKEKRNPFWR